MQYFQYLYDQSPPVIYRDLKPQNVVCDPNGAVRLIDFNISRKFNPDAARDTVFMGTTTTAPPEQYGYTQTDVRSDIYSLGVLMIFLGNGQYGIHAVERMHAKLAKINPDFVVDSFLQEYLTTKSGSCLCNLSFFAALQRQLLSRQCLNRRHATLELLNSELSAWKEAHRFLNRSVRWHFTIDDARLELRSLYPKNP